MTWLEILKSIHQTLDTKSLNHVSEELREEQLAGGTAGEMFTLVLVKLISIKDHQPDVYALIKEETEWMIAYGKSIDYF